jgi:hypothetical protein
MEEKMIDHTENELDPNKPFGEPDLTLSDDPDGDTTDGGKDESTNAG